MLTFYCYTWNKYLPPQKLIDGTCSFHSIRNANYMTNILENIKYFNNNDYIVKIKKEKYFKKMCSNNCLDSDLNKLIDGRKQLSLTGPEIKQTIIKNNLSKNIFPVYYNSCKSEFKKEDLIEIKKIMKKDSYVISFILFKQRLSITHWCPLVIDKRNNIVNIHIVDSYDMFWWGDPRINSILNYFYPGKKNVKCLKDNFKGDLYYATKTAFQILIYFFAIYLFIYALSLKLKKT